MKSESLVDPVRESVFKHASGLRAETDVFLQFFSGRAGELMRWEGFGPAQKEAFYSRFKTEFQTGGLTRLFDTVDEAVDVIRSVADRYERISFIIFSDGDDKSSSNRAKAQRWSLITPELLKLAEASPFARTYLIALPGQNPTAADLAEFEKSGIIYTAVPKEAVVIPEAAPEVSFEAFPTKAEPGQAIRFTASNTGGAVERYDWTFGATSSRGADAVVEHVFAKEGRYSIALRAVGRGGEDQAQRRDYITIAYSVPLEASFSVFPEKPVSGQEVLLTSTASGKPEALEWRINGRVVATASPFRWTAPAAGEYSIHLRVQAGERIDTANQTLDVAPPPPDPSFRFAGGDEYDFGATVRAEATATGPGLTHSWTVAGAETLTGASVEWTADREGLIEFVHRVENERGALSIQTDKVLVRKPAVILPEAGFTVAPLPAELNAELKMTADATEAGVEHEWHVDGKQIGGGSVIRYVPEKEGNLVIRHVLRKGEFKKENSSEIFVRAPELAQARFKASDTSGAFPLEVGFSDKSKGKIVAYRWDFGDGNDSTEANPIHTYQTAGEYTVTLTVTNAAGRETISPEPVRITVKEPLPGWVKWAVIGAILAIILLILYLKLKAKPISGILHFDYEDHSGKIELGGTRFDFASLEIPGWTPRLPHTIENKDGNKLFRNGIEAEVLDRRKEFEIDGADFKYLP